MAGDEFGKKSEGDRDYERGYREGREGGVDPLGAIVDGLFFGGPSDAFRAGREAGTADRQRDTSDRKDTGPTSETVASDDGAEAGEGSDDESTYSPAPASSSEDTHRDTGPDTLTVVYFTIAVVYLVLSHIWFSADLQVADHGFLASTAIGLLYAVFAPGGLVIASVIDTLSGL